MKLQQKLNIKMLKRRHKVKSQKHILIDDSDWEKLVEISESQSDQSGLNISTSDMVRKAIKNFIKDSKYGGK